MVAHHLWLLGGAALILCAWSARQGEDGTNLQLEDEDGTNLQPDLTVYGTRAVLHQPNMPTRKAAGDGLKQKGAWAARDAFWAVNTANYGETPDFVSTGRPFANSMLIIKKEGDAWRPNPSFFAIVHSPPGSSADEDTQKEKDKKLAMRVYYGMRNRRIRLLNRQISEAKWQTKAEEGVHFFPSLESEDRVNPRTDKETFGGKEFTPGGYGGGDFLIVQLGYHKKDDAHFLGDGYYWRQGSGFLGGGTGLQVLPRSSLPRPPQ